jgi:hypothetical protein
MYTYCSQTVWWVVIAMVIIFIVLPGTALANDGSHLHAFAETDRYGFKFYTTIFSLTMMGMLYLPTASAR